MAEIPAWIWILVGIFVIIVSSYVGNLQFFVIIGALMIAWGVFKIARDYMIGPPVPRKRPWEMDAKSSLPKSNLPPSDGLSPVGKDYPRGDYYNSPSHEHGRSHKVQIIQCPECKTQVWSTAHFCHFCGMRIRNPK